MSCNKLPKAEILTNYNYTFIVDCGDYTFKEIIGFGLSPSLLGETKNTQECKKLAFHENVHLHANCSYSKSAMNTAHESCFQKKSVCQFAVNMANINKKCSSLSDRLSYFFLTYRCESK